MRQLSDPTVSENRSPNEPKPELNNGNYTKAFTKQTQYTKDTINMFENTFGKHHMSAGGEDMTQMMAKKLEPLLNKKPFCRMLDIGFGVGGSALEFSEKYNAEVYGIDLNQVGWKIATTELNRRNQQRKENEQEELKVSFHVMDASKAEFDNESFDVIYSRDTLLHLDATSKQTLFTNFTKWLKPGGMVCIADYCLGRNSHESGLPTPNFTTYLDARGYHMYTPNNYAKELSNAGLENAYGDDLGIWYCITCQKELDRVLVPGPSQDDFLSTHSEKELASLQKTYGDKIQMTLRGDRSYVMVTAMKSEPYMEIRTAVSDAYKQIYKDNLIMSCDGNISARVDINDDKGLFVATPSGVDVPDLTPSKIVLCDSNGKSIETTSKFKPTSEIDLHTLIYQTRKDVGAIVHSHSIYASALACCRQPLIPAHYAVCELICDTSKCVPKDFKEISVQCTPYHTYGTWPLAVSTLNCLGNNYAVLLANHGAVVVGKDLEEAMYFTERLERECEIYYRSLQFGKPQPLTCQDAHDLHARDLSYGQDAPSNNETTATTNKDDDGTDAAAATATTSEETTTTASPPSTSDEK